MKKYQHQVIEKDKRKTYVRLAFDNLPNECNSCKSNKKLTVHHKDFNKRNNNLKNLEILCFKCHMQLHQDFNLNKTTIKIRELRRQLAKKDSSYALKINKIREFNIQLQNKLKKRLDTQKRNHNFCQVLKDSFPEVYKQVVIIYKNRFEKIPEIKI